MHYIVFVEHSKGLYDLTEVSKCCFFREPAPLFKNFFEIATVAVLINKVKIVYRFEHIIVFDDVGRRL